MSRLATQLTTLTLDAMPPSLTHAEREATTAAAASLAPLPGIALEMRLGAAGGAIDLSQPFDRAAGGAAQLAAAARAQHSAGWRRLAAFADWWGGADGDLLDLVWIERDARGVAEPSLFLHLARPVAVDDAERAMLNRMAAIDDALWAKVAAALAAADALELSRSALFGLMLSRAGALRLTFPDPGARTPALLTAIGWPGHVAEATEVLTAAIAQSPRHQIVADFAPAPLPHLGVEFTFDGPPQRAAFDRLLDWLVAQGWATTAASDFLKGWHGRLTPQAEGWPDALVVAGILGEPAGGTWLRRRCNHLKLVFDAGGAVTAKAYFGLQLPGMRA